MSTHRPSHRAALCLAVAAGLAALAFAAPAWALGSTPVTVVNPTTSPVPSTIVNPTTSPVPTTDVTNPAFQPFQRNLFPNSTSSNQCSDTFQVPAGKRLVIEYYSSQPQDLSGGASGMTLATTAGGNDVLYIVYVNANTTDARNQTTRIYADPGTSVQAFAFNAGTGHSCAATINVSGYLVNVP